MKMVQKESQRLRVKHAAHLIFDLAAFLWKWTLALLVISNDWLSVSVTIAGVFYIPHCGVLAEGASFSPTLQSPSLNKPQCYGC